MTAGVDIYAHLARCESWYARGVWRPALLILVLVSCGRLGFDRAPGAPDGASDSAPPLIVSLTQDRMAGPASLSAVADLPPGTTGLSLREALVIASNHPGPDSIQFDATALPAGTIIAIAAELVVGDTGTAIEAATLGIIVAGTPGYAGPLFRVTGNAAVIDGLELRGGGTGVEAGAVSGLVMRQLAIHDTAGDAIHVDGASQLTIDGSRIERAGGTPVLVRSTRDAFVQHNFVSLADKTARIAGIDLQAVTGVHVLGNTIDPGNAFLVSLTDSSDNEVIDNILDRGDTGVTLFGDSHRNLVFRNVVISPAADSVFIDAPATGNTIVNNTFYMAGAIVDGSTGTVAQNNLISTNTGQFVHAALYDFHLVDGDPAIDGGTDLGLDMLPDQPARFFGSAPDLGAVESH